MKKCHMNHPPEVNEETLLAAVLHDANDAVIALDFQGRILTWNPAAETLFDTSLTQAMYSDFVNLVPERQQELERAVIAQARSGQLVPPYESIRLRSDGEILDVWVVVSLLHTEEGAPYAIVTTERDISAAKIAERALHDAKGQLTRGAARAEEMQLASDSLRAEKEILRVTLASIGDAVITTDPEGRITYLNPVAEQLTGWLSAAVQGVPLPQIFRILSEATRELVEDPVLSCLRDGTVKGLANNTLLIARNGSEISIDDSAAPIFASDGEVLGAVLIFRDVTEKRRLAEKLAEQAKHDPLTGLVNRRELLHRLARLLDALESPADHALLFLDLDQFKIINDTCGHVAGDELLRQVGALMLSEVRGRDTLARIGGDEFGILLENCSLERALAVAEHLRQKMLDFRFGWKGNVFTLGVSIGAVPIIRGESVTSLLSAADAACYAAKQLGRNRVHLYRPNDEYQELLRGEMQWTSRIENAVAEGRFQLYYQPIIALNSADKPTRHGEILLRLVDEAGRVILPGEFIPAAERYDQMGIVDRWVINACFDTMSDRVSDPDTTWSINVSGQSIGDREFLNFVMEKLGKSNVRPTQICFEITETAAISNLTHARGFISTLKKLGCRFALDDFGSGLSSFGYLQTLPVDFLKIDGRFISNLQNNPIDRALVESIHLIGSVMGMKTVAEWVENEATLNILKDLGVDYAQGYAIGRPTLLSH